MINALASVPFVIWGLEASWASGRWRGAVLGGLALAFQVFAGHLQDALLTIGLVGLYGHSTEPRPSPAGGRGSSAAGNGGGAGRRWVFCSRPCNGFRPRSCSIARRAPAG